MNFLDTQIVSYAIKGREDLPVKGAIISAITANELLLVQGKDHAKANYYVPIPSKHGFAVIKGEGEEPDRYYKQFRRDHPYSKNSTDQVLLDFGNKYPSIIEYGNLAISMLINNKASNVFDEATKVLSVQRRKRVRNVFDFLIDNEVKCLPLTKSSIALSMELLQKFSEKYNFKGNFRNSLNDILILASAIDSSARLVTEDSLLKTFAAEEYAGDQYKSDDLLIVDFSGFPEKDLQRRADSKGYINRSWQVKFRNYGNSLV